MTIAYVDCFSGISGDMFLGALVDAGLEVNALRQALESLPVSGYTLESERVTREGITGHAVRVRVSDPSQEPERHLSDIETIIRVSRLESLVQDQAIAVFRTLGEAEATVHGVPIEAVHFHEVGAIDSIVDIVGVVWGLRRLGIDHVYASSLPTGSGSVQTAHGLLPVPAPATLAILAGRGALLRPSPATTELVTPTGAALLATLATFRQPTLQVRRVGYGFGQKKLPWANVARLWIGEEAAASPETDTIGVLEANLDDENPEILGATMQLLLAAGALDVFFTPVQMKKNRPAVKLTVLSSIHDADRLSGIVLRETSTLGVRTYEARRLKARRWHEEVATPWGNVRVKMREFGSERGASPEYEDCLRLAQQSGVTLANIYRAANAAIWAAGLIKPKPSSRPTTRDEPSASG